MESFSSGSQTCWGSNPSLLPGLLSPTVPNVLCNYKCSSPSVPSLPPLLVPHRPTLSPSFLFTQAYSVSKSELVAGFYPHLTPADRVSSLHYSPVLSRKEAPVLEKLISAVICPGHRGEAEFGPLGRIQLRKKRQIAVLWGLKKLPSAFSVQPDLEIHSSFSNNGKRRSNYSRQN